MREKIDAAIALIARVPGYEATASGLGKRPIRFVPTLEDRGQATLTGEILLGPEALEGELVGLAGTLVHEHYHTTQNPFAKTPSFWQGVFTRTPVMARYERPAYRAELAFFTALATALPEYAPVARQEAEAAAASFAILYRLPLGAPGDAA